MKSTVAEHQLPKKNGLLTRAEELKMGTKLFDQVVLTLGWWRDQVVLTRPLVLNVIYQKN